MTNPAEIVPSATKDTSIRHLRESKNQAAKISVSDLTPVTDFDLRLSLIGFLSERDFAGGVRLLFDCTADFEKAVKHLRTLGAA